MLTLQLCCCRHQSVYVNVVACSWLRSCRNVIQEILVPPTTKRLGELAKPVYSSIFTDGTSLSSFEVRGQHTSLPYLIGIAWDKVRWSKKNTLDKQNCWLHEKGFCQLLSGVSFGFECGLKAELGDLDKSDSLFYTQGLHLFMSDRKLAAGRWNETLRDMFCLLSPDMLIGRNIWSACRERPRVSFRWAAMWLSYTLTSHYPEMQRKCSS